MKNSDKAAVLENYPKAFAHSWADCWIIYSPHQWRGNICIGRGKTQRAAWTDALNHGPDTSKR